jgi:hypothetical protein
MEEVRGEPLRFVWHEYVQDSPTAIGDVLPESAPPIIQQSNLAEDNSIELSDLDPMDVKFESQLQLLRRYFPVLPVHKKQELMESLDQLLPSDSYASLPVATEISTQPPHSRRLTIPSDQASGTRGNKPCRFQCLLCHNVSPFSSLGTFKRHVTYSHYPRSQFLCPHSPQCPWLSSRRDKIHEHLRTRHSMLSPLSKQEIKDLEVCAIPPVKCPICEAAPFESWDKFFRCFSSHCRLEEGPRSDSTHRDSNGSGDGFGDSYFPGSSGDGPGYNYSYSASGDTNNFTSGGDYSRSWNGNTYQFALTSIPGGGENPASPQMMMKHITHYHLPLGTVQLVSVISPITVPCPQRNRRKRMSALIARFRALASIISLHHHSRTLQQTKSNGFVGLEKRNPTSLGTCTCMALKRESPYLSLDHSPYPPVRIPHPTIFWVILLELLDASFPRAWKELKPTEHSYPELIL